MQDHDHGAHNTQPHEDVQSGRTSDPETSSAAPDAETAGTEIGTGPASSTDITDEQEPTDLNAETVQACPECNSSDIHPRHGGVEKEATHDWYCRDCGARCNEPVERPPLRGSGTTSAMGQKLLAADPDEAIPDGGSAELEGRE
jgi:ribosomal protein L37AE/L43A